MPYINPRGAVLLVLALIGAALAAGLFAAPANRRANRYLGCLLLVLAGMGVGYTVGLTRLDRDFGWLRHLPIGVPLAVGPLLYGYARGLVDGRGLSRPWLHLAPAGLQLLYLVGFYLLPGPVQAVLDDGRDRDLVRRALDLAVLVSMAAYSVAGLQLLARYRAWLVQNRSDAELYAARWVRNLLAFLLLTMAAQVGMRGHVWLVGRLSVFDVYGFYLWLGAIGVYMGVEGRRYADRPFPKLDEAPAQKTPAARDWVALGAQYRRRTLEAGWWREPGLSLAELSRRLAVNTSYLSRAINEGLGQNFSELINGMRAEAVAAALHAGDKRDLLEIAFDAGFSSKASFNRAFRARFGRSPSDHRAGRGADHENPQESPDLRRASR